MVGKPPLLRSFSYAPSGSNEYIFNFFAVWLTKLYNAVTLVPRWLLGFFIPQLPGNVKTCAAAIEIRRIHVGLTQADGTG